MSSYSVQIHITLNGLKISSACWYFNFQSSTGKFPFMLMALILRKVEVDRKIGRDQLNHRKEVVEKTHPQAYEVVLLL